MRNAILSVLEQIPSGCIFDNHFVINQIIKYHSDEYLSFAGGVNAQSERTLAVHGQIGIEIKRFEGNLIERIDGLSYSENIHGNASTCTCWKKI